MQNKQPQKPYQAEKPTQAPANTGKNPADENFNFDKKHEGKTPTALDGKKPAESKESDGSCTPCGGKDDSAKSKGDRL